MNDNLQQITFILEIVMAIIIVAVIVATAVYIVMKVRISKLQKESSDKIEGNINEKKSKKSGGIAGYNKQSIFDFMEFDRVEDNMIVQKNGKRFLMVLECQGVNYDLMSDMEKTGVEEGFVQFLNTLRYPIQLYVQTRTINLEKSIENYKARLKEVEDKLNKMEIEYSRNKEKGVYSKEEQEKAFYEMIKQRNLYEYSKDIIYNTEQMNKNRNVLNKKYYVIIPYYSEEAQNDNLDKEEIKGMAFSELYTRSQAIARALSSTGVTGKILTSVDLVDFLYVAYNRDESEVYDLEKAIKAGVNELYATAKNVLDKRMIEINKEIEAKANIKANEMAIEAMMNQDKARKVKQREEQMDELIDVVAKNLLDENEEILGTDVVEDAKELIDNQSK